MNFIYFVLGCVGGWACIRYRKWIVDNTARVGWAEQYLGGGGTYTMWLIIGVALFAAGFYYLFHG